MQEILRGADTAFVSALLSAAADVCLAVDASGMIQHASGSGSLATARTWVGRRWIDTVTTETQPKVIELLAEVTDEPSRWRQVNHGAQGGAVVPVSYTVLRFGARGAVLALGRDMSAAAAAQQHLLEAQRIMGRDYASLRAAETRYRLLFQASGESVLIVDAANALVVDANPAAAALLGMPIGDLRGRKFPLGVDAGHEAVVTNLLATAQAAGAADQVLVNSTVKERRYLVSAQLFQHERSAYFLVRMALESPAQADHEFLVKAARLSEAIESLPDGFVVTTADGEILSANRAFLDIVQLPVEMVAKGKSLSRWLGRPGVDLNVLMANLRQHGSLRLFTTRLRGELGAEVDVEISAVVIPQGEQTFFGMMIRDIGRRLSRVDSVIGERVPRSVEDLSELIGQVPLKEIVRQTTDLIERLCIEAALNMTEDNRASAAEMLGLSRQGLYTKLRRYGLGHLEPLESE
jgi:transcriptional regulator PpsR